MVIRKATLDDLVDLRRCVAASLNATYEGLWTSAPLEVADAEWGSAWVASSSDHIIGVGLSEHDVVSDLWVRPDAQGRGAGSALLRALEGEIASRGIEIARLRCLEPNLKSRAFYASQGWVEMHVYPHETIPLNTVDMKKHLVPAHS